MSAPLLFDSLLVHYLAAELDTRLSGRRLRRVRFAHGPRRLILELDEERLVWELHPTRGGIRVVPDAETGSDEGEDAGPDRGAGGAVAGEPGLDMVGGFDSRRVPIRRRGRIRRVSAPPDERLVTIEIEPGGADRAARLVVELLTNRWNALALAPDGRILAALVARDDGDRPLRSGSMYAPPPPQPPRAGLENPVDLPEFASVLADSDDPVRAVVRSLAWTSALNARAIVDGLEEGSATVEDAWERYRSLVARPEPRPGVIETRRRVQPYPLPLPGRPHTATPTLVEAFEAAPDAAASFVAPEILDALRSELDRVRRRAERLEEERDAAPSEAAGLRGRADLIMARMHQIAKGAEEVELEDFDGSTRVVRLDPARTAVENAEALYDRARRRERAGARLPERVREAREEASRLEALIEGLKTGAAGPADLGPWLDRVRPDAGAGGDAGSRLPYRTYRSSGGLEIRVGRSGKANDALTFHHSAPDDIWLHARDASGAHVILRWADRDQNPPQRDLLEAAVLAALNSRARTSGTVPVDWTRRKYVRSPRGAPPGAVIPSRVSTVFVEPDPGVEERLGGGRAGDGAG